MSAGIYRVPNPSNEAVIGYAPGSAERARLQAEVERTASDVQVGHDMTGCDYLAVATEALFKIRSES